MTVDERLLTIPEVAERMRVHPESVRRWIREGKLMAIRVAGSRLRVPESALEDFLKEAQRAG